MTDETNVFQEWVMIGTSEPQNFYFGKVVNPEPYPTETLNLKWLMHQAIEKGTTIRLTQARLLLTAVQIMPNGSINMMTQLMPISGSGRPVDLYIKPTVVVFPSDVEGMMERLDEMAKALMDKEQENRVRALGIELSGSNPDLKRKV